VRSPLSDEQVLVVTNAFLASGLFGQLLCDEQIAREFGADAFERRMRDFELAWTQALRDLGAVDAQAADRALAAIGSCSGIDYAQASTRDGVPVPAFVAALRRGLDDAAARAIHTGATSQDVLDTAMVLTLLAVLDDLGMRLSVVLGGLADLETRHGTVPLMARTRMQAARVVDVAHRVDAWRRPLVHHAKAIDALRLDLGQVQVGGAVGLRDAPPGQGAAMASRVASALGLAVGPVWHSDRTPIMAFGHWLAVLCGSLGKIGQDICLMAQQGVDDIALRGGGQSSAMA
jgi:3-carboxy-cis,cis-muconate cycloisomerase